jgi:hypothetical protein
MTQTKQPSGPMSSIYDGQQCVGFVLKRGKDGAEAFNSELQSLGTHPTEADAIRIVWSTARQQS